MMATLTETELSQEKGAQAPTKSKHNVHKPRYSEPPERQLFCSMTRKYGAVEITFGVQAPFAAENESDQQRGWLMLEKQVSEMHDEWALNLLPSVKGLRQEETTGEFDTLGIWVDQHKNLRLKTKPGTPYSQFGVNVSPLQLIGFVGDEQIDKVLSGEYPNWIFSATAIIGKRNGKSYLVSIKPKA